MKEHYMGELILEGSQIAMFDNMLVQNLKSVYQPSDNQAYTCFQKCQQWMLDLFAWIRQIKKKSESMNNVSQVMPHQIGENIKYFTQLHLFDMLQLVNSWGFWN